MKINSEEKFHWSPEGGRRLFPRIWPAANDNIKDNRSIVTNGFDYSSTTPQRIMTMIVVVAAVMMGIMGVVFIFLRTMGTN